jgi:hypothetical protein
MNFPKELVLLTITKLPGRAGPINKDKPALEGLPYQQVPNHVPGRAGLINKDQTTWKAGLVNKDETTYNGWSLFNRNQTSWKG